MIEKSIHEEIYEKISYLFKIKFKAKLNDSPIDFESFLQVKDVVSGSENYVISFRKENEIVKFRNKEEFIISFVKFIDLKLSQFEDEFNELQEFESNSMGIKYDENEVYLRHEHIGYGSTKLDQIKKRLLAQNN